MLIPALQIFHPKPAAAVAPRDLEHAAEGLASQGYRLESEHTSFLGGTSWKPLRPEEVARAFEQAREVRLVDAEQAAQPVASPEELVLLDAFRGSHDAAPLPDPSLAAALQALEAQGIEVVAGEEKLPLHEAYPKLLKGESLTLRQDRTVLEATSEQVFEAAYVAAGFGDPARLGPEAQLLEQVRQAGFELSRGGLGGYLDLKRGAGLSVASEGVFLGTARKPEDLEELACVRESYQRLEKEFGEAFTTQWHRLCRRGEKFPLEDRWTFFQELPQTRLYEPAMAVAQACGSLEAVKPLLAYGREEPARTRAVLDKLKEADALSVERAGRYLATVKQPRRALEELGRLELLAPSFAGVLTFRPGVGSLEEARQVAAHAVDPLRTKVLEKLLEAGVPAREAIGDLNFLSRQAGDFTENAELLAELQQHAASDRDARLCFQRVAANPDQRDTVLQALKLVGTASEVGLVGEIGGFPERLADLRGVLSGEQLGRLVKAGVTDVPALGSLARGLGGEGRLGNDLKAGENERLLLRLGGRRAETCRLLGLASWEDGYFVAGSEAPAVKAVDAAGLWLEKATATRIAELPSTLEKYGDPSVATLPDDENATLELVPSHWSMPRDWRLQAKTWRDRDWKDLAVSDGRDREPVRVDLSEYRGERVEFRWSLPEDESPPRDAAMALYGPVKPLGEEPLVLDRAGGEELERLVTLCEEASDPNQALQSLAALATACRSSHKALELWPVLEGDPDAVETLGLLARDGTAEEAAAEYRFLAEHELASPTGVSVLKGRSHQEVRSLVRSVEGLEVPRQESLELLARVQEKSGPLVADRVWETVTFPVGSETFQQRKELFCRLLDKHDGKAEPVLEAWTVMARADLLEAGQLLELSEPGSLDFLREVVESPYRGSLHEAVIRLASARALGDERPALDILAAPVHQTVERDEDRVVVGSFEVPVA